MKLISTVCPQCGANLRLDSDKDIAFCEHCGAQILIDDDVQHIKYDNAEQAGYEFEKGRQRALKEANISNYQYVVQMQNPQPKRNTWLWVLGWIFFFPAPVMVLIWRQKNTWSIRTKIIVTVVFWILVALMTAVSNEESTETVSTQGKADNVVTQYVYEYTGNTVVI